MDLRGLKRELKQRMVRKQMMIPEELIQRGCRLLNRG
jgi:hypothetical protein